MVRIRSSISYLNIFLFASVLIVDVNLAFHNCIKADRAKQIKCKAIVNEDPTEKLIADLKAENERLKKQLAAGGGGGGGAPGAPAGDAADVAKLKQEEETMKKQLEENEKNMKLMQQSYEEKLAAAKAQVLFEIPSFITRNYIIWAWSLNFVL